MQIEDAEIAATAIEATTQPELWGALCDKIARRLGAKVFTIFKYDIANHTTPIFHTSLLTREAERLLAKVVTGDDEAAEDRVGYEAVMQAPPGTVMGEADIFGFAPQGSPPVNLFRDRVLEATGATSRSTLRLNDIGPWLDAAITHDKQADFGASVSLTKYATPLCLMLQRTMEANRLISRLLQSYNVLLDLFDRLKFGVAFCNADGGILVANEQLRHWAREKDALTNNLNQLAAVVESSKPEFHSALMNSADLLTASTTTVSLARRSGETPLVAHITPINDKTVLKEIALLIIVLDPAEERQITGDGLATVGSLTSSELHILNLLLRGLSTSAVSERRGTSVETVRGQIKSIMLKLECKRRVDLIRLAMVTSPNIYLRSKD